MTDPVLRQLLASGHTQDAYHHVVNELEQLIWQFILWPSASLFPSPSGAPFLPSPSGRGAGGEGTAALTASSCFMRRVKRARTRSNSPGKRWPRSKEVRNCASCSIALRLACTGRLRQRSTQATTAAPNNITTTPAKATQTMLICHNWKSTVKSVEKAT